ncbi:MAG: SAF domain-containing protein [Solirubrobacterales bacterium]
MSPQARTLAAAGICAALAGWLTFSYTGRAARGDGPATAVVVTTRAVSAGDRFDDAALATLAVRLLPRRFAPAGALGDPAEAAGTRAIADLPAGSYVTAALLAGTDSSSRAAKLRPGERALTVDVLVSPAGDQLAAGDRVDLFASGFGGGQATNEVLAGAEVLAAQEGAQGRSFATLRLAAAQVGPVIRADVFARELRAVVVGGR